MGAGCSTQASVDEKNQPISAKPQTSNDGAQQNLQITVQPVPSVVHGGSAVPYGDEGGEEDAGGESVRDPQLREDALKRCFEALDRDKSGTIDFKELKQYLFKTGVNISQIEAKADELLKKMDVNNDSQIDVTEFTFMMDAILSDRSDEDLEVWVAEVVFTATSRNVVGFGNSLGEVLESLDLTADQMEALKGCFRALDRDQSGFVELPELRVLLGKSGVDIDTVSEEVTAIMAKLDKNGDQRISEQEFFVALSAVRKSLADDLRFAALVGSVTETATLAREPLGGGGDGDGDGGGYDGGQLGSKQELAEVLLASEAG